MEIFLAGGMSARPYCILEWYKSMDIYLAGSAPWKEEGIYNETILKHRPFILESFYYTNKVTEKLIPLYGKFLLDSGAFTFMSSKKGNSLKWDDYVERYADFINRNKVDLFFELDIDSIVGIKEVERLRSKLERLTGKQSIPVWHKNRGKDYFSRMCDEYKYVAIGLSGLGEDSRWSRGNDLIVNWFVQYAHSKQCRIHGLGFTRLKSLKQIKFDSVDSTAWVSGNRFGCVFSFDGSTMQKRDKKENERMINTRNLAVHNFKEWVKFQEYAKGHL